MPWSTREIAELAGTTVNTVRHYHRIGLLDEPERRYNGYKQYEVWDLVTLLRIKRLANLGLPLSQIVQVSAGADSAAEILRGLHAELQLSIERLQKAQDEVAAILGDHGKADAAAGSGSAVEGGPRGE
jgi:DNA-binding transcriptional MerR regulator